MHGNDKPGSVHLSKQDNDLRGTEMNASDLAKNTVKALNVIARDLGMKRYSKLRKAELIVAIERELEIREIEVESTPNVKILDVEVEADHAEISAIMAAVTEAATEITCDGCPVIFPSPVAYQAHISKCITEGQYRELAQNTLAKASQIDATATDADEDAPLTVEEIVTAYTNMKRTWNRATGKLALSLMAKLIKMRADVKAMGFNPVAVGMGYSVA